MSASSAEISHTRTRRRAWQRLGSVWIAIAVGALAVQIAPVAQAAVSGAAPRQHTVCTENCATSDDITLTVPQRSTPVPPPKQPDPPAPPPPNDTGNTPQANQPAQQTHWGTNAQASSPSGSTDTTSVATESRAPAVGTSPKTGVANARFRDNPHPQPGETAVLIASGFAGGEKVQVVVFSEPIVVGSWEADAEGHFEHEITIPEALRPGTHTVELTGWDSGHVQNVEFEVRPGSWAEVDDSRVWMWWLGGGALALLLLALALILLLRKRSSSSSNAGGAA